MKNENFGREFNSRMAEWEKRKAKREKEDLMIQGLNDVLSITIDKTNNIPNNAEYFENLLFILNRVAKILERYSADDLIAEYQYEENEEDED